MTTFTVSTRDDVSPASQAAFDSLQNALGFVPNLYATIAYSDNALPKYLAFQGATTKAANGIAATAMNSGSLTKTG